jgi:hypothetical protein
MRQRLRRSSLTEAEKRDQTVRDGNLQALAKHPAWPDLEQSVGLKRLKLEQVLLAHTLGKGPVNQRFVDYNRGLIDGMQWLVSVPTTAENRLERYLKEHAVEGEH